MNRKTIYAFLSIMFISTIIMPFRVMAFDTGFYSTNDILFYNPDDCSPSSGGTASTPSSGGSGGATGSIPYELPATSGKTGVEESIDSTGLVKSGNGRVSFKKFASLGQAYRDYYITMRWTWTSWNWNGTNSGVEQKQLSWLAKAPRIVLVTNPRTKKSIYTAVLESGPAPWTGVDRHSNNDPKQGWTNPQKGTPSGYTGRVAGLPPVAIDALGAKQGMYDGKGDVLTYEWASNQSVTPGPTNATASGGTGSTDCAGGGSSAGEFGWELTGANAMVYYDQSDTQWKNKPFGSGTLGQCGCGPTSLAMIVATLTGDKKVNPENMAAFYSSHGGQDSGCGSSWNWGVVAQKYNLKMTDLGKDLTKAKAILKNGGLVLFSWTGAPFTGGGHIMVMRKYSPDGKIYIASSGGSTNEKQSDQAWDESIFTNGYSGADVAGRGTSGYLKGMWGFEKK